jgi:hypothetical protein
MSAPQFITAMSEYLAKYSHDRTLVKGAVSESKGASSSSESFSMTSEGRRAPRTSEDEAA